RKHANTDQRPFLNGLVTTSGRPCLDSHWRLPPRPCPHHSCSGCCPWSADWHWPFRLRPPPRALRSAQSCASSVCCSPPTSPPPPLLLRSNPLPDTHRPPVREPFSALLADPGLRAAHLEMLQPTPERAIGDVDVPLVVAFAKVDQAQTFEQAVALLSRAETFA